MLIKIKKVLKKMRIGRIGYRNTIFYLLNKSLIKLILKSKKKKNLINYYKTKFNVDQIWLGHFHFDYNMPGVKIFEAYAYRHRVYETKIGYIATDVHIGLLKYRYGLEKLIDIIKNGYPLYILGDLTEHTLPIEKYTDYEKKFLEIFIQGIKKGNVHYIRGNHDSCYFKKRRKEYIIKDNILLIHGDFLLQDPFKPECR